MFHRWLALFDETVRGIGNPAMQARANELARRIAESLWFGYQMHRDPQRIARSMSH
jgi:hemoglobin